MLDGKGAYSGEKRTVLFTVITRYQLLEVKKIIHEVDSHAFVDVTETIEVIGMFDRGQK